MAGKNVFLGQREMWDYYYYCSVNVRYFRTYAGQTFSP